MLDVREILDGDVWPQDPRSFGGDEVDILEEQLASLSAEMRRTASLAVLMLFGDDSAVIRTLAVKSLPVVFEHVTTNEVRDAIASHEAALSIAPIEHRNVREPTLFAAANARLDQLSRS
jgi:hypothetical protein